MGFPSGTVVKNPPANTGDAVSIPGLRRCPEEANGNPSWYACLRNPVGRRAWQTTVHAVAKNQTQLKLCAHYIYRERERERERKRERERLLILYLFREVFS